MRKRFSILHPGPGPFIGAFCDAFSIVETTNDMVDWDRKQWKVSPGHLVKAMIINILCGRTAFFSYENFFRKMDTELIFGHGIKAKNFKDDALAAALDRIYAVGPRKYFSQIVMKGLVLENVDLSILHGDTTSKIMYGEYNEEGDVIPNFGYSKDKRPDLKQIVYGLLTSKDGIPVDGNPNSGNKDDKTWNQGVVDRLPELFSNLEEMIYIADSACVHGAFLDKVAEKKLQFISLVPRRYSLPDDLIEKAWQLDQWEEIGQLSEKPKSASYKIWETEDVLEGRAYRFVVVYSSQLDKRKLNGLNRRLEKKKEELTRACSQAMKNEFACEKDAQVALDIFVREHQNPYYSFQGFVEKKTVKKKRKGRGRPKKDEVPQYQEVYQLNIQLNPLDEEAVAKEKNRLSCFVLISNIQDSYYTGRRLLEEYKSQSVIENKFKFIKSPIFVGPMLFKKNHRIETMAYVVLLALFIYSNIERRVRAALEKETTPLVLGSNVKTFRPTGERILELITDISVIYSHDNTEPNGVKRELDDEIHICQRVFELAGIDTSVYQIPPHNGY